MGGFGLLGWLGLPRQPLGTGWQVAVRCRWNGWCRPGHGLPDSWLSAVSLLCCRLCPSCSPGIPPAPRGVPKIAVSFSIDANGEAPGFPLGCGILLPLLQATCMILTCGGCMVVPPGAVGRRSWWQQHACGAPTCLPAPCLPACHAYLPSLSAVAMPAGILNVTAKDKGSGKVQSITIKETGRLRCALHSCCVRWPLLSCTDVVCVHRCTHAVCACPC